MKRLYAVFFILFFIVGLNAQENTLLQRYLALSKNHKAVKTETDLTSDNLESINWYYSPQKLCDGSISLTFYKNKFILYASHMDIVLSGSYELTKNQINCRADKKYPNTDQFLSNFHFPLPTFALDYIADKSDFWFGVKLVDKESKYNFYALGLPSPKNNWYVIDGYDVYKYDGGIFSCTDNLNVRDKPDQNSTKITLLKANTKVDVIGKTKKEDTINGKKACWYLVDYAYEDEYCPAYNWVYGAFLEPIKK